MTTSTSTAQHSALPRGEGPLSHAPTRLDGDRHRRARGAGAPSRSASRRDCATKATPGAGVALSGCAARVAATRIRTREVLFRVRTALAVACASCERAAAGGEVLRRVCARAGGSTPAGARRSDRSRAARLHAETPGRTHPALARRDRRRTQAVRCSSPSQRLESSPTAGAERGTRSSNALRDPRDGVHRFEERQPVYGRRHHGALGAPIAHETTRSALLRGLHLLERLREFAAPCGASTSRLATRIGLNSGEVVVGKIGDDLRMDYRAGCDVGLAQRVEALAEADACFVTQTTATSPPLLRARRPR